MEIKNGRGSVCRGCLGWEVEGSQLKPQWAPLVDKKE